MQDLWAEMNLPNKTSRSENSYEWDTSKASKRKEADKHPR